MAAHFKEKEQTILEWPWVWFCHKWARLYKHGHEEREREEQRKREQELGKLKAAHQGKFGSGWG